MIVLLAKSLAFSIGMMAGGLVLGMVVIYILMIAVFLKKVPQGQALIRSGLGETKVSLRSIWVIPFLHRKDLVDLTIKKVPVSFSRREPLNFQDGGRAVLEGSLFFRVNPTEIDIKRVAQAISPAATFSQEKITDLFQDSCYEAIKMVTNKTPLSGHIQNPETLKMATLETMGDELNGYVIDDMAIKNLTQVN